MDGDWLASLADLMARPQPQGVSAESLAAIRAAAEPAPPVFSLPRLETHPVFRVEHSEEWHEGRQQMQRFMDQAVEASLRQAGPQAQVVFRYDDR